MATVPENQKVTHTLATIYNQEFTEKAAALTPTLHEWVERPLRLVRFVPDDEAFFKCRPETVGDISSFSSLLWGKGDEFILDFGSHRVGYLSFHLGAEGINIDAPTRLRLTFGEVPYDVTEELHPCDTWISTSWLPDETINVDWVPTDVSLPRRYSFRYLRVQVIDTSPKYKVFFKHVTVRAVSAVSPVAMYAEPISFGDDLLDRIDQVSMITLRDCMQTVFEDGPRRDRRLWSGDLRLQALTNYCTFKDYALVRRCLYLFAALPREDSSLPACLFEKPMLRPATDYIVDYDVLFGSIVHDYAKASDDLATAEELWPTVLNSTKVALSHVTPQSTFSSTATSAWKFLDWASNLDTNAGMHGVVIYGLKHVNSLARLLSKPPPFESTVNSMIAAAESHFYDREHGVFVSGPDRQVSWASQAWMALAQVLPAPVCKAALLNAMSDPNAVKPETPYLYHQVAEALSVVGAEEECVALIKAYWGGMVRAGADTFWECFDPADSRLSPYGDCHNNSYCHAWSCTPSFLLRSRLQEWFGGHPH